MRNQTDISINERSQKVVPFLRWAGGKRWFLKHLDSLTQTIKFNNYHEPFLGSGAVFFYLNPQKKSFLSDLNPELINTYSAVRDNVEKVITELSQFKNTESDYYKVRGTQFRSRFKKAAQFIYLNQTSFNGIYRVNLKGIYNVPYGNRNVNYFNPVNLRILSKKLFNSTLEVSDFSVVKKRIAKNDLIFLDPPYTITHNQNGFVKYNQKLFSIEDQYRLSALIDEIKKKNAYYILTNAAHKKIEEIFEKGDTKLFLSRASLIGGNNAVRGVFQEAIFTNTI